ncbi:MAG: hypothetical protein H6671_10130 [Anaerolineaceae bacterium]|nr:hypothetical protein [Anaerolineaceae bacterium]
MRSIYRSVIAGLLLLIVSVSFVVQAQTNGVQVQCPGGPTIENGVEVVINMRSGFTYTATAIGMNGFDPVLAVYDASGTVLCNDDDSEAASYSASLPTTGFVPASGTSAQMPFFNGGSGFADISLVVGGYNNLPGEFILVLEGMAVTSADGTGEGSGDPFSVHMTPNMQASGVPVTAYMISVTNALDPLMKVMDDNNEVVTVTNSGDWVACDDAGNNSLCWGQSQDLSNSYVSRTQGRQLPGGPLDAMMTLPWDSLGIAPGDEGYVTWRMSSSGNSTFGDYLVVFHMGTGDTGNSGTTSPPVSSDGLLRQWASDASGSSQYGESSWSFVQAAGAPDTNACGDFTTAWASATSTGKDTITLEYSQAVYPTQVNIYETYNPGSIVRVELMNTETGATVNVPASADPPGNTECPGVFTVDISGSETLVNAVTIYLDQTIGGNWNEIDAVELVGRPASGGSTGGNTPPPATQPPPAIGMTAPGVQVQCPGGPTIENGVEVVINMRTGFTYTATAIGLNGFDPILAVYDNSGTVLCNDDDPDATSYSASLPTTGFVPASGTSAQMPFFNGGSGFADISLVVGGYNNLPGEFILVLEGMAVTSADGTGEGSGDPFSVHMTPNMQASGVPVTAYMISVTSALDPLMKVMDDNNNVVTLDNGNWLACDDAGNNSLCWGQSQDLSNSYVSRTQGRQLPGGPLDAMMTLPWDYLGIAPGDEGYVTWRMSSSGNNTFGDYLVVFHMGTSAGGPLGQTNANHRLTPHPFS